MGRRKKVKFTYIFKKKWESNKFFWNNIEKNKPSYFVGLEWYYTKCTLNTVKVKNANNS